MPGIVPFNAFDHMCTVNQCLLQVVGSVDNNPVAQYNACVSMFGSPSTLTATLPPDVVTSTATVTVPYTDIIVALSTADSISYATTTSYEDVYETVTVYSSTSIATVTEVATAPTAGFYKKRSNKKRGCRRASSSASTSTESTSALFPLASNCVDLAEYSSACSCINAVSSTTTATAALVTSTDVTTVTESSAISSTSTSVVTIVVSSEVVVPATTTVMATATELDQTTVTVTSTTTPVAPTQTAHWVLGSGSAAGRPLNAGAGQVVTYATVGTGNQIVAITAGGQPSLVGQPDELMFVQYRSSSPIGFLLFETAAQAAQYGDLPVNCSVEGDTVSCVSPTIGWSTILQCSSYIFLAQPGYSSTACQVQEIKLVA